ncbi:MULTISPECIES: hypothetical protein [Moorena]|nr:MULTISPECIES: hypothetical protein [Moorena]
MKVSLIQDKNRAIRAIAKKIIRDMETGGNVDDDAIAKQSD